MFGTMYINEESADHAHDACIAIIEAGSGEVMPIPEEIADVNAFNIREVPESEMRIDGATQEMQANADANDEAMAQIEEENEEASCTKCGKSGTFTDSMCESCTRERS